jgi:guanine nucleotide-binding protein subunit alpha
MGLCGSTSLEDQVSRQIDRDLHTSEQTASWETKILLLGAGGSGKSTVMRQFKMLYTNGFKEAERLRIRKEIRKNIVQGLQLLVQATRDHTIQTANIAMVNHKHIDTLYAWDPTTAQIISSSLTLPERDANVSTSAYTTTPNPATTTTTTTTTAPPTIVASKLWSMDMTVACIELLKDPAILSAIEMSSKLQLEDSLRYFKDHISRVGAPAYIPSDTDIAHVRIRTKGVHPLRFQIGPAHFLCVDVGGQRNERRKWISQFDNVDAVLFVASIAAFDMTLIEETSKNRACEAIELFEELSHSPYFRSTDLILFLNKKDLLADKLNKGTRVADFFSDYTGDNSYDDVVEYFVGMYKQAFARAQNVLLGGGMETLLRSDSKRLDGLPDRFSSLEEKHQEGQGGDGNGNGGGDGGDRGGVVRRTLGGDSMWSSAPRLGGINLNRIERESVKNKQLYVHVTHATDQENVEFTFQSCQDIILRSNLNAMML